MTNSKAINVLAAVTIVAAWYGLYLFLHPHPPKIDLLPHKALGEVLAAEALKLLDPGARLIVIARDPAPFQVPAGAAQLDSCLRTIKKSGKSVTAIRRIKLDPLRLAGVPPGDFYDLIRQGRTATSSCRSSGRPCWTGRSWRSWEQAAPHFGGVFRRHAGAGESQENLRAKVVGGGCDQPRRCSGAHGFGRQTGRIRADVQVDHAGQSVRVAAGRRGAELTHPCAPLAPSSTVGVPRERVALHGPTCWWGWRSSRCWPPWFWQSWHDPEQSRSSRNAWPTCSRSTAQCSSLPAITARGCPSWKAVPRRAAGGTTRN